MTHILVVDSEHHSRKTLLRDLKSQGLRATGIDHVMRLPAALAIYQPDAILLEMTAETQAVVFEGCKQLRTWNSIPVIIVSSLDDSPTKIQALNVGADDYLVRPFGAAELTARIRAIERRLRKGMAYPTECGIGNLSIDLAVQRVKLDGQYVHLTRSEYRLLRELVIAQGSIVSYEKLLLAVQTKKETRGDYSTIRSLIRRLRIKLKDDAQNPIYILTEAGLGYRLNIT
jgi:two-component system, OmpR family, KDP operon response regulator KdpE